MRVTPFASGRNIAARVELPNGDWFYGIFDRRQPLPEVGQECEAMICKSLRRADVEKQRCCDWALLLQPVTEDNRLVRHNGFECAGSMCRTTANITHDPARPRSRAMITPGRTPVYYVDNVNVSVYQRQQGQARKPVAGYAYLSAKDEAEGHIRICGVPEVSDLDPCYLPEVRRQHPAA